MSEEKDIHIIGQGTYGCVYRPNIDCETNEIGSQSYLSKIQRKDKTSKNEIKLGKKITSTLDESIYTSRFAPILESCPVNIGKMEQERFSTCKMIVQGKNKIKKTGLMSNKLNYVGKLNLGNYLESGLMNNQRNKRNAMIYCKKVAETHLYLLKSIEILNNIGILHLDLKHNNIMFDDVRGVPIIIDFGLSYDSKHLDIPDYTKEESKPFGIAVPFYIPWTIETVLLSYLAHELKGKGTHIDEEKLKMPFDKQNMFKELCNQYVKKNALLQSKKLFKEEEKENYKKMLQIWVESWKGKTCRDVWVMLSTSHKTWDNYSLCALYLIEMQISGLLLISDVHEDDNNSFLKKYILVLKKELLTKPNARSLPETTRKELHSIFSQANKKEYNKVVEKFKTMLSENKENIKKERNSYNMNTLQEEKGVYNRFNN
jgi:serine/threonine protein kinase